MTTRVVRMVVSGVLLMAAVAYGVAAIGEAGRTAAPAALATPPVIRLDVASAASAGEPVSVAITTEPGVDLIPVVVRSGTSTHRFAVPVSGGRALLRIDGPLVDQAGSLEIRTPSAAATVELSPGPAVDGFDVLAGPHTVVADGADRAVAVVVPRDRLGNPVADGTAVDFEWQQPGRARGQGSAAVAGLLAHVAVPSGTRDGTSWIGAVTGSATGVSARIVEVPGRASAVEVTPLVLESTEIGDAIVLESGVIVDRFDNRLPDGIEGHFRIETASGVHVVPAVVQAGRLRAWWVPEAGAGVLTATVNGVTSDPIQIDIPTGGHP